MLRRIAAGERPWGSRDLEIPDVGEIVRGVRDDGDAGVARAAALAGDRPPRRIDAREIEEAYRSTSVARRGAMHAAAGRIEALRERSVPRSSM